MFLRTKVEINILPHETLCSGLWLHTKKLGLLCSDLLEVSLKFSDEAYLCMYKINVNTIQQLYYFCTSDCVVL